MCYRYFAGGVTTECYASNSLNFASRIRFSCLLVPLNCRERFRFLGWHAILPSLALSLPWASGNRDLLPLLLLSVSPALKVPRIRFVTHKLLEFFTSYSVDKFEKSSFDESKIASPCFSVKFRTWTGDFERSKDVFFCLSRTCWESHPFRFTPSDFGPLCLADVNPCITDFETFILLFSLSVNCALVLLAAREQAYA